MPETVIDIRITLTGDSEVAVSSPVISTASDEPVVKQQVDNFLPRLGDKNKAMVRAFIKQRGSFTFDDIAAETAETYDAIKMRKFNLGRSINKVSEDTGSHFVLIESVDYKSTKQGWRTIWKVPKELRDELRSRQF